MTTVNRSNISMDKLSDPDAHSRQWYSTKEAHPNNGTLLGFWFYLMSDCLIFAVLFAVYAVIGRNYAGGPSGADLFNLPLVAASTAVLLVSSFTYGMAMIGMHKDKMGACLWWLAGTGVLGSVFLGMTLYEFSHLIGEGAWHGRSAFLSAFFTLVGVHALHVAFGVLWLLVLMIQVRGRGFIIENKRRLLCLSMFWHFLDVIWIGVFSFVYLMGVL